MQPLLGRLLEDADVKEGAAPVAVISHALWRRVFNSNPQAIGRSIRVNGQATTVVGIMPPDFEMEDFYFRGRDIDLWIPLVREHTMQDTFFQNRGAQWLRCIGRLRKGISIETANAEIKAIGARLSAEYPDTNSNKPFLLRSLWRQTTKNMASPSLFLLGAVALLLLVACANVASMLLARGARRQSEFGVRMAMGGSHRDIIRLLLCESLFLALLGCGIGIVLAKWGFVMMQHVIPSTLLITNRREALQLNSLLFVFSIGLSVLSGLLSGLLPAFSGTRTPVMETLKSDGRTYTSSRIRHRFLRYLAAGQIAVTVVLGNGALLFSSSYLNVIGENRGIGTDRVVTASFALWGDRYGDNGVSENFLKDLFERVHALPGVTKAAITSKLPLEGGFTSAFLLDNEPYDPAIQGHPAETSWVSPEYFGAMGLSLISGRFLESEDNGTETVGVVVNQTLANQWFSGQNPIGKTIRFNNPETSSRLAVVGVVADARQFGAENRTIPEIYYPYDFSDQIPFILVVRATGDVHPLIPQIRQTVNAIDPDLSLSDVRTMKDVLDQSIASRRLLSQLIGLFMVVTLLLAMAGIYGTLSYIMSQRRQEIGIRMALGAMHSHIMRFVFRQAAAWVFAGLALGLVLTVTLSVLLRSAFYGVSPVDPLLLLMGFAAVGIGAGAACFFPTRRATRVEPMEALRCE
jgi:predicted permease